MFPIHKKGDKSDPYNYRGISLLSVVSKVYEAVLYKRVDDWCEGRRRRAEMDATLCEEQGGFRRGRGCVDQIFVLSRIIENRNNRETFCCFIDLKKAYDRVWRDGLWKALFEEGIRGKMWRVLKSLYKSTLSKILLGQDETEYFEIEAGVRQGCVLSPLQ